MNSVALVIICLLASVGLVQLCMYFWFNFLKPCKTINSYYIITLPDSTEDIEVYLRYSLNKCIWYSETCPVIVLCKNLSGEAAEIVHKMTEKYPQILLCTKKDMINLFTQEDKNKEIIT